MKGAKGNLKSKVFEWLGALRKRKARGEHVPLVSDEVVNRRAAICYHCPANISVSGGCGSCKRALRGLRSIVLDDRASDVRLGGCSILAVDLQVLVMLDEPSVNVPALPGNCWKKA